MGGVVSSFLLCHSAFADSAGALDVIVTSTENHSPIAEAHVFLLGWSSSTTKGLVTDRYGRIQIGDVEPGTYRLIVRSSGYADARQDISVRDSAVTSVNVQLARMLKTLAVVRANSTMTEASTVTLTDRSAERKLSSNLISAINLLAGANVSLSADGQFNAVSIRGHDPTATGYNVGGLRVGGSVAQYAFDPDMLNSAQIDLQHEQVALLLKGPSSDPTYSVDQLAGGFESSRLSMMVQDTSGATGFVLAHVNRDGVSALNGASYLDESGLSYAHLGTYHAQSSMARVVAPLSPDWRASFEYLSSYGTTAQLPDIWSGPVPEGFGPGNFLYRDNHTFGFSINGTVGPWLVSADLGTIRWKNTTDDQSRIVALAPLPSVSVFYGYANPFSMVLTRSITADHGYTILLNDYVYHSQTASNSSQSFGGDLFGTTQRDASLEMRDERQYPPRRLSLTSDISLLTTWTTTWRPQVDETLHARRGATTWTVEGAYGAVQSYGIAQQPFDDPASATFDCNHDYIIAHAPGDTNSDLNAASLSLGFSQTLRHASISATAYSEVDTNALISTALVPAGYQ